ncbi:uncharacterized protein BT62DRAFT_465943 [Guyanagaster necrorhizus]|uniref:Abscisic acid G-protein coupled receptor-like domain-containing protein n=1 Tax=Guyanagaster necrorhizus TaxID=856835 RepID=A0A9P7VK63_9AGAR|nr:uncharacterized protein BT62DRAFT_465943 [Guyanagaster necrorhizus MCA 3950]KAG7441840.1 hypothetical protein BT62DRAFT_465943 [Guyanagaster necrorhizus MCA 3950]
MRSCWLYLLSQERPTPTDRDIEMSTAEVARIREDLRARMDEAKRKDNNENAPWYSRVVKSFGSDDSISREISGLQALEYQMALSLDDKRERQWANRFSRTLYGCAWNLCGKVFAVYCVIRILNVWVFFPATGCGDLDLDWISYNRVLLPMMHGNVLLTFV